MKFQEALVKSEFFFIYGRKGTHRLLLPFWIAKLQGIENLFVLSFENKTIYEKEIANLGHLLQPADTHFIQRSSYLTLKNDAQELKSRYGYSLLLEDIKSMVSKYDPQMLILYLLDLFFKVEDTVQIGPFVSELFSFCKEKEKKMIIVCNEKSEFKEALFQEIENYMDCQLSLQKEEHQSIVEVESCFLPLHKSRYCFGIEQGRIVLDSVDVEEGGVKQRILLLSEDEYIVKLHRYILEEEQNFSLSIAKDMAEIFEELLSHPDTLIYVEKKERSDFEICKLSKKYDLNVLLFLDKEFVRREDQAEALERGCAEVLPKTFAFEDYIAIFQKDHKNFFYSKKLSELPKRVPKTKEEFWKVVEEYLNKRVFFTLVKASERIDEDRAKLLREKDLFFQDENEALMVIVNVRKIHIEPILKKLRLDSDKATIVEAMELESQGLEQFL